MNHTINPLPALSWCSSISSPFPPKTATTYCPNLNLLCTIDIKDGSRCPPVMDIGGVYKICFGSWMGLAPSTLDAAKFITLDVEHACTIIGYKEYH